MPGPDEKYRPNEPILEEAGEEDSADVELDAWRYRWAVDWPIYDHRWFSTFRRTIMQYIKENYSETTKHLQEKEDLITLDYKKDVKRILSGTYAVDRQDQTAEEDMEEEEESERDARHMVVLPRFLTTRQMRKFTDAEKHREIAFGHDKVHKGAPGTLEMGRSGGLSFTNDVYEVRTRSFLWHRLREEQRDASTACIVLIILGIIGTALGLTIMGLATREVNGGNETVLVSGLVSGIVMVIASFVGIIGALAENEAWIRCNMTGAFWTMAVLTSLLYINITYMVNTGEACEPSERDHTQGAVGGDCKETKAEIVSMLIFSGFGVLVAFWVTYTCSILLDAINDGTRLQDSILLLRYFSYRHMIFRDKLDTAYGPQKFGPDGQLGTYNNISPAYCAMKGLHLADTKLTGIEEPGTEPVVGL